MKKVSALRASCGPLHFASCVINFIRVCTRHKLRDKGPRPFHSKIFTKLFSFFVRQRKIKTKKENTKSFLQKKIGIRIPTPPIHPTFSFSIYFYLFYFYLPNKIEKYHANISSLFSSSFSHFIFNQS